MGFERCQNTNYKYKCPDSLYEELYNNQKNKLVSLFTEEGIPQLTIRIYERRTAMTNRQFEPGIKRLNRFTEAIKIHIAVVFF